MSVGKVSQNVGLENPDASKPTKIVCRTSMDIGSSVEKSSDIKKCMEELKERVGEVKDEIGGLQGKFNEAKEKFDVANAEIDRLNERIRLGLNAMKQM